MKKLFAIALVAIMIVALCISTSAIFNIDRIFVNVDERIDGAEAEDVKGAETIEIAVGDKLYTLGWAANPDAKLVKIVWSVDNGDDQECSDSYRDRPDLALANVEAAENGSHAGFGYDTKGDDHPGMIELLGIDRLGSGTYNLEIKAIYEDETSEEKEFALKIIGNESGIDEEDPQEQNPGTADVAIVSIVAVACTALAGTILIAKKHKS